MFKSTLVIAVMILSACSMPNTKPGDGREWVEVSCNGFADWTKCYEKAARLCPGGYDMSNRHENLVTQGRTISVACKK